MDSSPPHTNKSNDHNASSALENVPTPLPLSTKDTNAAAPLQADAEHSKSVIGPGAPPSEVLYEKEIIENFMKAVAARRRQIAEAARSQVEEQGSAPAPRTTSKRVRPRGPRARGSKASKRQKVVADVAVATTPTDDIPGPSSTSNST